jgi:hypothetical protein
VRRSEQKQRALVVGWIGGIAVIILGSLFLWLPERERATRAKAIVTAQQPKPSNALRDLDKFLDGRS